MNEEVIAWLRSQEGETWSRQRIRDARAREFREYGYMSRGPASCLAVGADDMLVPGLFSIKKDG